MIFKPLHAALFSIAIIMGIGIYYHTPITYGLIQGVGQLGILMRRQPVETYIQSGRATEEHKEKLKIISEIIEFAVNDIGLTDNGSYRAIYDQHGKPLLFLVKAAPEFSLDAYEWHFPIAGSFSYLGFFERGDAVKEAIRLKKEGYDVRIRIVEAWSTLGFFKDPIFTGMLSRNEGSLARLIIHEMTHGTIFIKNDMQFNENIATFVGDTGGRLFLEKKYGKESKEAQLYSTTLSDNDLFYEHLMNGAKQLEELYKSFTNEEPLERKRNLKEKKIKQIFNSLSKRSFHNKKLYKGYKDFAANNAYFAAFLTYRANRSNLQDEYTTIYNSNLPLFIDDLKKRAKSKSKE